MVDAVFVVALILTAVFAVLAFDIVENAAGESSAGMIVEIDEALGLAFLLIVSLLVYGYRRLSDQRRELQGRLDAETKEKRALQLALLDPLTGVANRRHFQDTFSAASSGPTCTNALFMLDMDGFKGINDEFGHPTGDEVLRVVAGRLQVVAGKHNLVSRLGGDEFAVLAFHIGGHSEASRLAEEIRAEIERPIAIGGRAHFVGVSLGMSLFPQRDAEPAKILAEADEALYRDKHRRRADVRDLVAASG